MSVAQPRRELQRVSTRATTWLLRALMLVLGATFAVPYIADAQPDPRPESPPYFYDPESVFSEDQTRTLARDGKLLQSSEIPIVVYVRVAAPGDAAPESSRAFAETVRTDWAVETTPGADDGLVILYSHVPQNPAEGSIVAAWGEHTFNESGLTPGYIDQVLAGDSRTLLNDGHPFEGLVYAMRQIRYGGIYFPPPPPQLSGSSGTAHKVAAIAGPTMAVIAAVGFFSVSRRLPASGSMPKSVLLALPVVTLGAILALGALSVHGQSRIGVACALAILIALGLQMWLRTHPSRRNQSHTRQRSVPPTSRRMRKRIQQRRLLLDAEGRA